MDKNTQIVIGLMGGKSSGKDTLADAHIEEFGATGKIALAEYLKNLCAEAFRLPTELFFTEKKDEKFKRPVVLEAKHIRFIIRKTRDDLSYKSVPLDKFNPDKIAIQKHLSRVFESPRKMLQYIGTDLIQSYCKEFHAQITYNKFVNKPGIWFITDLRFAHEYRLAQEKFPLFYPILIERKDADKDSHISELEFKTLKPFAIIKNNSTVEKYIAKSLEVFKEIKEDAATQYELVKHLFNVKNDDIEDEVENEDKLINGKFVFTPPQEIELKDFDQYDNQGE